MKATEIVTLTPEEIEVKWATQDFHDYRKSHDQPGLEWMVANPTTPEEEMIEKEEEEGLGLRLKEAFNSLTPMEQIVMESMYYGEVALSQADVAKELHITQGRVSQLHSSALERMKKEVA